MLIRPNYLPTKLVYVLCKTALINIQIKHNGDESP